MVCLKISLLPIAQPFLLVELAPGPGRGGGGRRGGGGEGGGGGCVVKQSYCCS